MWAGLGELPSYIFFRGDGMSVPMFWREIPSRYNLSGSRCTMCGAYHYPARNICPKCRRSGKIEPYKFKGTGEVVTYTVINTPAKRFEKYTPYILAIIKLDEGPMLTAQLVCEPDDVRIGMRVRAVFRKMGESGERGIIYYGTKFVPA